MERIAVITGSFDPITAGHEDLARRAARMFDKVYVVVLANAEKKSGTFSAKDRLHFVELTFADEPRIEGMLYGGLASDAAAKVGAKFIVRGVRSASDFDYEYSLSLIMKRFDNELETVIIPSSPEKSMISSTYVRELLKYNCPLGDSVPLCTAQEIRERYDSEHSGR